MRPTARRLVLPVVVASVLVAGQGVAQARTAHRATTTITVSGKQRVAMSSNLRPGVARFFLSSNHSVYLLQSRHGAGTAAVVKDWNASTSTGFVRDFTTIAHMPSRTTTVTSLSRGTYYAVEGEIDHLTSGLVTRVVVSGRTADAARPASVALTVNSGQTLSSPATLPARRFAHIVNNSAEGQALFLYSYHATSAEMSAFLAHPTLKRLGQIAKPVRALTYFDAHRSLYTDSRPVRGKYLIVNFSYGRSSTPRFTTGQAHLITVG